MIMCILVVSCADSRLFYAGLVGKRLPYLGCDESGYKTYEPGGYINFVNTCDAELVRSW